MPSEKVRGCGVLNAINKPVITAGTANRMTFDGLLSGASSKDFMRPNENSTEFLDISVETSNFWV